MQHKLSKTSTLTVVNYTLFFAWADKLWQFYHFTVFTGRNFSYILLVSCFCTDNLLVGYKLLGKRFWCLLYTMFNSQIPKVIEHGNPKYHHTHRPLLRVNFPNQIFEISSFKTYRKLTNPWSSSGSSSTSSVPTTPVPSPIRFLSKNWDYKKKLY